MTMTLVTNLRHLLAEAAAGHPNDHLGVDIPLDTAARLYTQAAQDLDEGNYGSATDDPGLLPIELESTRGVTAVLNVHGLRYVVELELGGGADTVTALCEVTGCPSPALGRTRLARVCDNHLDEDTTTTQAFAIPTDSIRDRRLHAWEREIVDAVDRLNHRDLSQLKKLREGH